MILVSACLLGIRTRYDGASCWCPQVLDITGTHGVIAVCPELLGGLGVPRAPATIVGGRFGREGEDVLAGRARVLTPEGRDVTWAFVAGARRALELALTHGVRVCYLKDRSPSCAYDPMGLNPDGGPGLGVFAALARAYGLEVREVRAWRRG